MSERTGPWIDPAIVEYVKARTAPADDALRWVTEQTATLGGFAQMQIGNDQVALMTILTQVAGVDLAVEVGTFTGTSSMAIARGLRPGGRLICCDVSEEWTKIAREGWRRAGVDDRIELRIGPALDTLQAMPTDPVIDLAFVDADKPNYLAYIAELVPRLRPGGLLLIDNTIWYGRVVDPGETDENTVAIRAVNDFVAADSRLESVILSIGDGLTIARKRA